MTIEQLSDEQRVKIFAALADPTRIETIRNLYKYGELSTEEICSKSEMDSSPSTRSYHGKILVDARLTQTRKSGREKFIKLRKETFEAYLPGFLDSL